MKTIEALVVLAVLLAANMSSGMTLVQSGASSLAWDHAGGVDVTFNVYISSLPGVAPNGSPDGNVATTDYPLVLPPGSYCSVVTALSSGIESAPSNELCFTVPGAPTFTGPLTWNYDTGAAGVAEFRVYVGTSSGAYNPAPVAVVPFPGLSWTVALPAGSYFAVVTAVSSEGIEGPVSNEVAFDVPAAPTNLRIVVP